jgi:hypothetical protein
MIRLSSRIAAVVAAVVLLGGAVAHVATTEPAPQARRMSFQNRLLLNRAVLSGVDSIEVLLLVPQADDAAKGPGASAAVAARVAQLGGRVARTEPAIGYLRVEMRPDRLLDLVASPLVDTYQIASFSRGTWYRDGPPLSNASVFRGFEVRPFADVEPVVSRPDLPLLTVAESREPGFTADDAGVSEWLKAHPTFDGRGVTIALVENALPAFHDPTLRSAKTLDGQDVPKIAGILNVLDAQTSDESRVRLDTVVDARTSWAHVGDRTYVFPRPGSYRFGVLSVPAGGNVVHRFAVAEDPSTREVWMDANGDASFQDEQPLADVNERFDPRMLTLTHPRKASVSFVMGRGREPHIVHIYMSKGSHQTMSVSVAAGSRTDESLAFGVAPNARVLLVRVIGPDPGVTTRYEGFIEAAQRPDVDVISASMAMSPTPDAAADFGSALFTRLVAVYKKPIIDSAGNTGPLLASTRHLGGGLSVGGILSPATWAALYGGRLLDALIVNPISAGGPSIDGGIKPDFLAPMERLAADLPWNTGLDAAPRNAPTRRLPPGYQVSCCTSSTSPYAAGLAALLISGAKQTRLAYTGEQVSRAMRVSARLVPGFPAHLQGNGTLDIDAAWRALASSSEPPRITASADIVHPLAQYAVRGEVGTGIFEVEGWAPGMSGTRTIVLRRESGSSQPVSYQLEWSADDGTFSTPRAVTLPLGRDVPVPVHIAVKAAGAHSGLLTLRDPATRKITFRTQATVIAAQPFDAATASLRVVGTVGLMRHSLHYVDVPAGVGAIEFALDVTQGAVHATIVPSHGLFSGYYGHMLPNNVQFKDKGTYQLVLAQPEPGTWTFDVEADSTWGPIPGSTATPDDRDAKYTLTMRLLESSITTSTTAAGQVAADVTNLRGTIAEPVLEASPGYLTSHRGSFLSTGLPNAIEIDVPRDAATLSLHLRAEQESPKAELHLYDCTTGECFSYNIGVPAARAHTLAVRKPNAGRWVAAVNAAPFPSASGSFVLDEIVAVGPPVQRRSEAPRERGARWRETFENLPTPPPLDGKTPILLLELLDAAMNRGEAEHQWTRIEAVRLRDRPVAIGTAIYRR